MMKRLILLLLWAAPCFAANTYYISKTNGLDTRTSTQAKSKATPWAHIPGMNGCTSNCASYSPVAGDQFILFGGDTWVAADLGVVWQWGGSNGSPIYIGVDQTWFTGASWTRPIFTCGGAACGGGGATNFFSVTSGASYVTIDNIEFTGLHQTAGPISYVGTIADHTIVEHCYFHGWSRAGGQTDNGTAFAIATNISNGAPAVAGGQIHDNVIDGSDTTEDMFNGIFNGEQVYNNTIQYVVSGLLGWFNDVHGNNISHAVTSYAGDHCNLSFIEQTLSGLTVKAYNNVIHDGCGGGSGFWVVTDVGSSGVAYVFNNVIYNVSTNFDPVCIPLADHASAGNAGTFYVYNNTCSAGGNDFTGNGEPSPRGTVFYSNNHLINVGNACVNTGLTCTNNGTNLAQTGAQANANTTPHFDQYTAAQTYAYSPVAGTNSTVGAGTNYTSGGSMNCTAVSALCNDTTYATEQVSDHTVVLRTVVARPAGGAWDIGAYEFGGAVVPPSAPCAACFVGDNSSLGMEDGQ